LASLRLEDNEAKRLAHFERRSRLEQLLIFLATGDSPMTVGSMKEVASRCGVRGAAHWNISDILRKSDGAAILTQNGWELTEKGESLVSRLARGGLPKLALLRTVANVRQHVGRIESRDTKAFVEEAIRCFESGQFRAAVVLSWVGAVSLIHTHVITNKLNEFNAEARRRNAKWKDARNTDELGRMGEHDFLDVVEAVGLIGRNVKQTLQNQCLNLRNASGHPNSLKISENNVAAHLDTLVLNAYSTFSA
jgi:hypothetical protein